MLSERGLSPWPQTRTLTSRLRPQEGRAARGNEPTSSSSIVVRDSIKSAKAADAGKFVVLTEEARQPSLAVHVPTVTSLEHHLPPTHPGRRDYPAISQPPALRVLPAAAAGGGAAPPRGLPCDGSGV